MGNEEFEGGWELSITSGRYLMSQGGLTCPFFEQRVGVVIGDLQVFCWRGDVKSSIGVGVAGNDGRKEIRDSAALQQSREMGSD